MTPFVFAFGAGLLATVNPCGFAMLPAFLAYYLGDPDKGTSQTRPSLLARLSQGFGVGLAVSVGFAGVFVTAGLLVSAGLRSIIRFVPWAAVLIGAGLAVVGVLMLVGRRVGMRASERLAPGEGRGYRRIVLFGAAYATASLSCTLAVLLAVVAQALATDNPVRMVGILLTYGLGAGTVLTALSVSAALAKGTLARAVRRFLPIAGRLGGTVLVLSGLYLVAYWAPVLDDPDAVPSRGLSAVPTEVSYRLQNFLDANQGAFVRLGLLLASAGALVLLWRLWRVAGAERADADERCGDGNASSRTAATHVAAGHSDLSLTGARAGPRWEDPNS